VGSFFFFRVWRPWVGGSVKCAGTGLPTSTAYWRAIIVAGRTIQGGQGLLPHAKTAPHRPCSAGKVTSTRRDRRAPRAPARPASRCPPMCPAAKTSSLDRPRAPPPAHAPQSTPPPTCTTHMPTNRCTSHSAPARRPNSTSSPSTRGNACSCGWRTPINWWRSASTSNAASSTCCISCGVWKTTGAAAAKRA
jgi:hypothetical protein